MSMYSSQLATRSTVTSEEEAQAADAEQAGTEAAMQMGEQPTEEMPIAPEEEEEPTEEEMPMMARGGKMSAGARVHRALHRFAMGGQMVHKFDGTSGSSKMQTVTTPTIGASVAEKNNFDNYRITDADLAYKNEYENRLAELEAARENSPNIFNRIGNAVRLRRYKRENEDRMNDLEWREKFNAEDYSGKIAMLNERKQLEDDQKYGYGRSRVLRGLMEAPAYNSIRNVFDRDKYIDPNKYTGYYEQNKALLHDDAVRVPYQNRPQYIDPNYIMSGIRSIGDNYARALQNSYAGHGAAAAAGLMANQYRMRNILGENALKALEYNNTLRQQDLAQRMQANQFNAQAQNALNINNDKLRTEANDKIAETHASADQYNKQLRTLAFANMAKNLGTLGRYHDIRLRTLNSPEAQTQGAKESNEWGNY